MAAAARLQDDVDLALAEATKNDSKRTQLDSIDKHELGKNDGGTLKVHGLPAVVLEIEDAYHGWIDEAGDLREHPLEVGEEGWVVECWL